MLRFDDDRNKIFDLVIVEKNKGNKYGVSKYQISGKIKKKKKN